AYDKRGWKDWGDFLGNGNVAPKDKQFLQYEEAKERLKGLGLSSKNEYTAWHKTNKPNDLPADPSDTYKNRGWKDWGDFLGTGNVSPKKDFIPYEEAKERLKGLGLKTASEYKEWYKTNKPNDLPSNPNSAYDKRGWKDWGDFLGTDNVSNTKIHIERKASTKALINVMLDTCSEDADFLKPSILVTLSSILKTFNKSNKFSNSLVNDLLRSNASDVNDVLNEHLHELDDVDDTYIDDTDDTDIDGVEDADIDLFYDADDTDIDDVEDTDIDIFDDTDDDGMSVEQAQAELDRTSTFFDNSLDAEGVDIDEVLADDNTRILIDGFVNHYAQVIINKTDLSCASVCKVPIVENFDSIKSYAQYTLARLMYEVATLKYPTNDCGIAYNSMQLQFANGVLKNRYYGNWSGTGVGKTLSFILASRVIDSRLTVVICTNNTKHQIAREIENTYNDSMCYVYDGKLPNPNEIDYSKHNYMIFNYEKGQLDNSSEIFDKLVDNYVIDYVVFDEVQLVKSTDCSSDSKRRELFVGFRNKCVKKYDSYISVLTATPITTCINEVSSIIELLTGVDYSASTNVHTTFEGCLVWHLIIFNFGCRDGKKPTNINGDILKLNTNIVRLDASSEVSMMVRFSKAFSSHKPLNITASTMYYKIDQSAKMGLFNKFTIIYTQFIGETIMSDIKGALYNNGLTYAVYTGEEKSGLLLGANGNVDWNYTASKYNVLITNEPIATGVDGMQKVCCNMVIACLPPTDKLYQQLLGRIYRQGSAFDVVDINILSVAFGEFHTYEDKIYNRIIRRHEYHKACVDGDIPMNDFNKTIIDAYKFNYDLEIETIREIIKAA
ncbi:MAG: hypothetical protein KBS62_07865, partial [Oscillospiraceae bacterium]|nr:hypothetical protein [Candidatus Ruminococcus equi]